MTAHNGATAQPGVRMPLETSSPGGRGTAIGRSGRWLFLLPALAAYTAYALYFLRPIWSVFGNHLTPNAEDPLFNLYVLKWGAHQARSGFPDFWDANFYHPLRGALALSDHLLGPALFTAAFRNPITAYNVLLFASFVLSGLATAYVLRASGCGRFAAALAGGFWAFMPFRLMHVNHIQILLAQWLPLVLWRWHRLLAAPAPRRALLFLLVYVLHLTGGSYLAYIVHVPLLVLLLAHLAAAPRALLTRRALAVLMPVVAAAGLAAATLYLPYVEISRRLGLVRQAAEIRENGATFLSYVTPPHNSRQRPLARRLAGQRSDRLLRLENELFPGLVAAGLAIYEGVARWRRRRRRLALGDGSRRRWRTATSAALLAMALAGLVWGDLQVLRAPPASGEPAPPDSGSGLPALLLMGALAAWLLLRHRGQAHPAGHRGEPAAERSEEAGQVWDRGLLWSGAVCLLLSHAVVYLPLMRVVPGLSGLRVPARFFVVVALALAYFAARGADRLLARLPRPAAVAAMTALALLLAVELAPARPLAWVRILREEEFPAVHRWVAAQPAVRALVELPIRLRNEPESMYHSTLHWKPIANGFSGYHPPLYRELIERFRWLPDGEGLELLRRRGVTHLIVHTGRFRRAGKRRLLASWRREYEDASPPAVRRVYESGGDLVYAILPPRR